jgi:hypothetical protein
MSIGSVMIRPVPKTRKHPQPGWRRGRMITPGCDIDGVLTAFGKCGYSCWRANAEPHGAE